MTSRRAVLAACALLPLGVALGAHGQSSGKRWRIGFFYQGSRESAMQTGRYQAFIDGMKELGYAEGRDFTLEPRFAEGKAERYAEMAAELIRTEPDLVVAHGSPLYAHLRKASTRIPVVVTVSSDPVGEGIARSLARPGLNFTGLSTNSADITAKQLELLKTLRPGLSRYALLMNSTAAHHPPQLVSHRVAASQAGITVIPSMVGSPEEFERAFADMKANGAEAVVTLGDTFFVQQRQQIAALALKHRLLSTFNARDFVEVGGLISYGIDARNNLRRAAVFVDKILKGARAADLPFEQPTIYELVINRKTAKLLGVSIPQSLAVRTNEVIE